MSTARFEVFIPVLPGSALSPNGAHGHWRAVSLARRELRDDAGVVIRDRWRRAGAPYFERGLVHIDLRVCRKRSRDDLYRPTDVPNAVAALKPVYDALVDAGLLADDDAEHMELGRHRIVLVENLADEGIAIVVEAA